MVRQMWAVLIAAVLFLAGCRIPTPPAPPDTPSHEAGKTNPGTITKTVTAVVQGSAVNESDSSQFPVMAGTFADEDHGWMVEDYNRILATTDGGRQWRQVAVLDARVNSLEFSSPREGWALTDKGQFATDDGGRTWRAVTEDAVFSGLYQPGGKIRWKVSAKEGTDTASVLLTEDSGRSWRPVQLPYNKEMFTGPVSFISGQTGWVLCGFFQGSGGSSKWLYQTRDGGRQWELLNGVIYGKVLQGFPPGIQVAPPGPHGAGDGKEGSLPTASGVRRMVFMDDQHGWLQVGQGPFAGQIWSTRDGGKKWTRLNAPGAGTGQFRFFTPERGRVLVNDQKNWAWVETRDGGTSWSQLYPALRPVLTSMPTIQLLGDGRAVAAHTLADSGPSWKRATEAAPGASSAESPR